MNHRFHPTLVQVLTILLAGLLAGHCVFAGAPTGPLAGFATSRTWTDASGQFRIEAKLAEATSQEVKLEKTDGRIVTLPLEKLSAGDRGFVEGFLAAEKALGGSGGPENPFEGGVPSSGMTDSAPAPTAKTPASPGAITFPKREAKAVRTTPINVDTSSEFWKAGPVTPLKIEPIRDMVVPLPMQKEFWTATQLKIAGSQPHLLVNLYRQSRKPEESYGRFGQVILPDGRPKALAQSGDPWKTMALSADAHLGAAVRVVGFDKGNDLGIFQLTDDSLSPVYEFTAGEGSFGELQWVGFLGNDRLVTISQKSTLTVWDLRGSRAVFRGKVEGALSASIGGNAELLAVPHSRGIAVFNCQDFKQAGFLPLSSTAPPSVAFSPDGRRLAAYVPFEVRVYELEDGSLSASIAVSDSGSGLSLDWIGDHLLLNKKLLIDVQKQMPAWTYEAGAQAQAIHGSQLYSLFANDKGASVVSVRLPHEGAQQAIASARPADLYVLQSGTEFAIQANLGNLSNQRDEIVGAVRRKLEEQGWRSANASPNQVTIELKQGERQETEYRSFGFHTEKVSYQPWIHTIRFTVGGEEVYRFERVVGAGFMLSTKEGESAQQAVDRTVKPSADIFTRALLPGRILKTQYRQGLGSSTITTSGLK